MNGNGGGKDKRRKKPKGLLAVMAAVAMAAAVATVPQAALADGHEDGGWSSDEIEFQPPQPVEGRRIFVERLSVSGDRAAVTLRAATDIDLRVRAFGGPQGTWLRFWGSASLDEGERIDYSLPLHGPNPSLTFSWEDTLGQAGAVTVESEWIPYPLPAVEGELCDLRVVSLGWTPGAVEGAVASECETRVEETIQLQTVAGHASVTETALMDAQVTAITGTVSAATGASHASVAFVPNGETRFRLDVPTGAAIHAVSVDVSFEAALSIPMPPLTVLTHHPARVEHVTKTVHLHRPGDSDSDSETATVACDDGATSSATATAYAYVPSATIAKEVTVDVQHPEHVKAETVERSPIARSRDETLDPVLDPGWPWLSGIGSDDPFEALVLPEPEPVEPPAEQDARRRSGRLVPHPGMGVAVVRRLLDGNAIGRGCAGYHRRGPRRQRSRPCWTPSTEVLTAMAYAAAGLCLFAIVWAGFVLMAEGAEERGGGRAKSAVIMAVVGLVLVLLAKAVAALLRSGLVPFPTP